MTDRYRRRSRGQALVVMVFAMVAGLAMVAVIVDGGNAWAQQRVTQNGSDSASLAGATILAKRLSDTTTYGDAQVLAAVNSAVAKNGLNAAIGYYTDYTGKLIRWSGANVSALSAAAVVGSNGNGDNSTPVTAAGVTAVGTRTFRTFVAGVIGRPSLTTTAQATAIEGNFAITCTGNNPGDCALMPIAMYKNIITCNTSGVAVDSGKSYAGFLNQTVVLPLCKSSSGSVGWLDWDYPSTGTHNMVQCVTNAATSNACLTTIQTPNWWKVSANGDPSAQNLEDALNAYIGKVILLPIYGPESAPNQAYMCDTAPATDSTQYTSPNFGCSPTDQCTIGGSGCNPSYYRLLPFAAFKLFHAYINGSDGGNCDSNAGTAKDCLIGQFLDYTLAGNGVVGPANSPGPALGVQLLK